MEIGHQDDLRWTIGLREQPFAEIRPEFAPKDPVFLVTGAAGSIVSAIVADLAAASGATFHLLDLAPEPDPADPDLPTLRHRQGTAQALISLPAFKHAASGPLRWPSKSSSLPLSGPMPPVRPWRQFKQLGALHIITASISPIPSAVAGRDRPGP